MLKHFLHISEQMTMNISGMFSVEQLKTVLLLLCHNRVMDDVTITADDYLMTA